MKGGSGLGHEHEVLRVPIDQIKIEGRFRKDYGDIGSLKRSIEEVGLLQLPVVDGNLRLVAGERRLLAVKQLGWTHVYVSVESELSGRVRVKAEYAENNDRKPYTDAEVMDLFEALEPHLKEEARRRQREHGGTAPGKSTNTSGGGAEVKGEVVEVAAKLIGVTPSRIRKLKKQRSAASVSPSVPSLSPTIPSRAGEQDVKERTVRLRRATEKLLPELEWVSTYWSDLPSDMRPTKDLRNLLSAIDTAKVSLEKLFRRN